MHTYSKSRHTASPADIIGQRYQDLAAKILADPQVKRLRLWLHASRNRASLVTHKPPPLPPPRPPRCQCYRPHRASSANGEDISDAR
jgi:hypothetical protein